MSKNDFKDNAQVYRLLNDPATCRSTFSNIMRTYQQCLYWHIRKMVSVHDDANDILQNTFIKAWKNILKYRGDANILTWLYRIATNETIDFLNSSYSKHAGESVDFETNLSTHLNNDPLFEGDELEKLLQKAIATLPDKQRLVFNMRYFDEMPYAEMSEILGTSESALKTSYHLAVKKVEKYILSIR
jgi:RNA polymerase sigma-70 factor (ECF subfamily)